MFFFRKPAEMPTADTALPGRADPIATAKRHHVLDRPLQPPFPEGTATVLFGMGCFWGAERLFWELSGKGVWVTAVGYAGGHTPNPTYEEVCSGRTGHNEVVLVAYDPNLMPFERLLKTFWEGHDPTQGMRQGNDVGTQYRSGIYTETPGQIETAEASKRQFQAVLDANGYGPITTEIVAMPEFYYAEAYHQQYLATTPGGYCGLGGTGLACPARVGAEA